MDMGSISELIYGDEVGVEDVALRTYRTLYIHSLTRWIDIAIEYLTNCVCLQTCRRCLRALTTSRSPRISW